MLAFIHVAKTGGQSIHMLLRSSFGARYARALPWQAPEVDDPFGVEFVVPKYDVADYRRLRRLCPFMRCVGGHSITLWSGVHEVEPTRYFAMIREPLKRGASHFQFHVRNEPQPLTWERWLEWPVHQDHQVKMFARDGDPEVALSAIEKHEVFIGLTERFDESLVILQRLVAPELNIAYRRINTARDNTIAHGILDDPQRRGELRRMYAREIPLYEFVANDLYPRFQREYGPTLEKDVEEFRRHRDRVNRWNLMANTVYSRAIVLPAVKVQRRRASTGSR